MSRALRLAVLSLLALALTGCFVSSRPLIAAGEADHPFIGMSTYVLSKTKDDGKVWTETETGTIVRAGDGYMLNGQADSAFTVRGAFDNYFIAQQAGDNEYYYDLLRIEGDHVYAYRFSCGDEDQRHVNAGLLDGLVGDDGDMRCQVSDFGRLVKVFRARLDAGALPKYLYVIK